MKEMTVLGGIVIIALRSSEDLDRPVPPGESWPGTSSVYLSKRHKIINLLGDLVP
jgi:hypothetical protein